MGLGDKRLESVEEADLQSLVAAQVAEGKLIEYKQQLAGGTDTDKKEFLADVSSFPNATGGDLIYGIREDAGVASEVTGVAVADPDAEIRRLDSIIQSGISPRIPGLAIRAIRLQNSNVVIIIRSPKSWAAPHRVIFKDWGHFFSRNSAGKYRLDVPELRAAFVLSETAGERIRQFRADRIAQIVVGEMPELLPETAKMVLHIVPLNAFDPAARYNISRLANDTTGLRPLYMHANGWGARHNFDGVLVSSRASGSSAIESYLQIFRNGIIEAVDARILLPESEARSGSGQSDQSRETRRIPSKLFEVELLDGIFRFKKLQKDIGVEPPLLIMVSLLGVKGYFIHPDNFRASVGHTIDRDNLILPEVLVESLDFDPATIMRDVFDTIWRSAGWPQSMNYDDNGNWRA